jgi:hypothetical protein
MMIKNMIIIILTILLVGLGLNLYSAIEEFNKVEELKNLTDNTFICLDLRYSLEEYRIQGDRIIVNNTYYNYKALRNICELK